MVRVLKLLIENSYLGQEMHRMASGAQMPDSVRKMLADLEAEGDTEPRSSRPQPTRG
jgi:hypothetical protein